MSTAVKINQINKDFPVDNEKIRVLFDINGEIRLGELTMLVGPSGCGKTTLISIISGILSPTSGDIELLGSSLGAMTDKQKVLVRRKKIGFIFQQYNLLPALTAAENAAIPLVAAGMSLRQAAEQAEIILDKIGMANQSRKWPHQLSGGQQQRVAIARALVHNPEIIVCDEPTAALDGKTGQAIMEILSQMVNDNNRAVLIVTHDNRIYHFADRILEMSDGRLIGDWKPDEFVHKD